MKKILFTIIAVLCLVVTTAQGRPFVLVIDAGHGGKDAGAVGAHSKEKDLNLRVALAFGQMIERNCKDIKVIYTRKTDVFLELWQRAEIANKNKADLFISVHTNSLGAGRIARGFQTYTLGKGSRGTGIQANLDVAKRENSVIFLEKDYKLTYQGFDPNSPESNIMFEFIQDNNMERSIELAKLMQKNVCSATGRANMGAHQDNLAVLRLSSMPGCLVELGFISTPDEENFLNAPDTPGLYANGLMQAVLAWKKRYFDGAEGNGRQVPAASTPSTSVTTAEPEPAAAARRNHPVIEEETPETTTAPAATHSNRTTTPANRTTTTTPAATTSAVTGNKPVFKVQVLVSNKRLRAGDNHFQGEKNVDMYEEGGVYKYTIGSTSSYNDIVALRKKLLTKFPECFIVAFKGGKKMDIQQAIKESKL